MQFFFFFSCDCQFSPRMNNPQINKNRLLYEQSTYKQKQTFTCLYLASEFGVILFVCVVGFVYVCVSQFVSFDFLFWPCFLLFWLNYRRKKLQVQGRKKWLCHTAKSSRFVRFIGRRTLTPDPKGIRPLSQNNSKACEMLFLSSTSDLFT